MLVDEFSEGTLEEYLKRHNHLNVSDSILLDLSFSFADILLVHICVNVLNVILI